jgi:hypothetical protein
MDEIIQYSSIENRVWISSLTPKDIAQILDTLSLVPHMKDKPSNQQPYVSELPANVGLQGELKFENIIQQYMPSDYKLVNTAKVGKCGDFIIKYQSSKTNKKYSLLVDIKNCKTTVPSKEIEKFYRDIKLNSAICSGLLLSLNSKIAGISKVIDFQDFSSNNGIVPLIFAKTNNPDIICEIIKMIFHLIEIKDINKNEILHGDEFISSIHELSNDVQSITYCRDNLQTSKTLIEKSLNDIMFSLMQCEYNMASKIKQINKSLVNKIPITLPIPPELHTSLDNDNQLGIKTVINTFKNSIELNYDVLLYSIYDIKWHETTIDIPKKQWVLYKENKLYPDHKTYMYIKFNKKSMIAVFPIQNEPLIIEIETDKYNNKSIDKGKSKNDGYYITVNPDNIALIITLCKCV